MSGLIPGLGESDAEKSARRNKRLVEAKNAERKKKLDKQKAEEALVEQSRGKKRVARAGRRRKVFTSPLGITDEGGTNLS